MIWFTAVTIITVLLSALNHWLISKGTIVYPLIIAIYIGCIIVETTVGLRDPEQSSILLFNLLNVWALVMAVKGWIRQKKNGPIV